MRDGPNVTMPHLQSERALCNHTDGPMDSDPLNTIYDKVSELCATTLMASDPLDIIYDEIGVALKNQSQSRSLCRLLS